MLRAIMVLLLAGLLCHVDSQENVPVIESLTARVLDNSSVEVKWTALADSIAKYKVTALATHVPPVILFTHNTSVTLKNLVPGKEYNIRVAKMDGEAAYARYADVNVTTCDIHPTVDGLRATFISDTSLIVTWSTAHNAMIHVIVCVISSSEKNCALYTANGDSMKCKIDVADDNAAYEVRARLSAPLGCIPCYSEESSVTVKRPATVPVNESLTARVLDNSSVKLKWTTSADSIAIYKVTALATHAPPVITFTRDTSVTLRNLVPGKEYNIRVAKMDGEAAYARYAEVNVTTCDIRGCNSGSSNGISALLMLATLLLPLMKTC
ncbi:hypothetical protein MRX96_040255 [Rhipicephalus microplus]